MHIEIGCLRKTFDPKFGGGKEVNHEFLGEEHSRQKS